MIVSIAEGRFKILSTYTVIESYLILVPFVLNYLDLKRNNTTLIQNPKGRLKAKHLATCTWKNGQVSSMKWNQPTVKMPNTRQKRYKVMKADTYRFFIFQLQVDMCTCVCFATVHSLPLTSAYDIVSINIWCNVN